jgi:hypothetical protein
MSKSCEINQKYKCFTELFIDVNEKVEAKIDDLIQWYLFVGRSVTSCMVEVEDGQTDYDP